MAEIPRNEKPVQLSLRRVLGHALAVFICRYVRRRQQAVDQIGANPKLRLLP
jgi:hypothetical protein